MMEGYIVRTFVNVTMYPKHNNMIKNKKLKKKPFFTERLQT
jgi:hypothetical protein